MGATSLENGCSNIAEWVQRFQRIGASGQKMGASGQKWVKMNYGNRNISIENCCGLSVGIPFVS